MDETSSQDSISAFRTFGRNFKSKWTTWVSTLLTTGVVVGSCVYVNTVLISESPPPPGLLFSPGRTVLTVNIFAHIVAFLIWRQVGSTMETMRWALASRGESADQRQGISLASFLALSRATPPSGVANLLILPTWGWHLLWGVKRLWFMGLAWLLGIILTSNVDYKYIFTATPNQPQMQVFAGLAPVTEELALTALLGSFIPTSIINFYYMTFCYSLLSDNRFSLTVPSISCSGQNCSSFFLPGGAAIIKDQDDANFLFGGEGWDNQVAVLVNNAPGYQLEFYPAPPGWEFDLTADCAAFGQTEREGLYMCVANSGTDLVAGWSICPQEIWSQGACFNNTSWQNRLDQVTMLTIRKRYATLAYSGTNFSILSMEYLSPASDSSVTFVPAQNLSAAISKVLGPISESVNATNPDWINVASSYGIMYGLGWGLRLYKNLYPNDQSPPLQILHNFLAVPFQFATTAIHYGFGDDHLPADLRTNATVATVYYRAIAEPWVLYLYAAVALFLTSWCIVFLFAAYFLARTTPKSTRFPEVDLITRYYGKKRGAESVISEGARDIAYLGQLPPQEDQNYLPTQEEKSGLWGKFTDWITGGSVRDRIVRQRVRFKVGRPQPEATMVSKIETGFNDKKRVES
ncbi:hypothetical protein GQ53DRAFT_826641 [Thozetella sp. PMI_491]|nr:hypothetical protein GQ53DRAFT_826641 [Thozetella sp. PMI_491]